MGTSMIKQKLQLILVRILVWMCVHASNTEMFKAALEFSALFGDTVFDCVLRRVWRRIDKMESFFSTSGASHSNGQPKLSDQQN